MTLYALEDIDDALDATRTFLFPIDRTRWIKLAVIVFFVGGPVANFNFSQYNVPAEQGPGGVPPIPEIGTNVVLLVAAVVLVALLVGLALMLVGSIMEFVLVESLRHESVAIRAYWDRRWRQGVRLFGFRLLVNGLVLGSFVVLFALFVLPALFDIGPSAAPVGGLSLVGFLLLLPVIVVLALVVGVVDTVTTTFVVPVMVLEDRTVLGGWRRLWPTMTGQPWQYLAYLVANFVLAIVTGLLVAIATGLAALLLLIPFGLLGLLGLLLFFLFAPLGIGVLAVVGVLFVLALLTVAALVQVPVVTYLRYYALLVLGDIAPEFDLISERRAAVRTDEL
ncbi:DUF7544 domain-containing protein [Haloarcula nitratireducens]|uniref:Glycerophosphoryl diester phosphodiesterase membrane domain-containing protein n=1 Tax=Haloarcula nitratireducens TaxID=2487749 RepID=A0AAW4PFW5_9EURY|nr:hypothetical protein [Halomicroarcula nitratireducens]MBX0296195.1 hypothetical protein [Halomicroarcula nitratireducens]